MITSSMRLCSMVLVLALTQACTTPTPLCFRPEVLQEVERTVRQRNIYNTVDHYAVAEAPTTRANAVACTAVIDTLGYVPGADGWVARPARTTAQYDVQVSGNRFVVQVRP